ncbi:MAG: chemotaxis protein CheW [Legionellaceae bacterium]|nr:chemotaxis protein CheW [Legionellaceae bacterium]
MQKQDSDNQYLKIKMGNQFILFALNLVKIVLRMPALHDMPNETVGFKGMLNYHGVSVPVYNLGDWIGIEITEDIVDIPLVLCDLDSHLIGFMVSDVQEVLYLEEDKIQTPDLSNLPDFVQGTFENEQESMWVVSLRQMIAMKSNLVEDAHE